MSKVSFFNWTLKTSSLAVLSFFLILCLMVEDSESSNICTVPTEVYGDLPGPERAAIKLTLTEDGMNQFAKTSFNWVQGFLSFLQLPDIHGNVDLSVANITYDLETFVMKSFGIGEVSISLQESTDLIFFTIDDVSTDITFTWDYAEDVWPYIGDGGWGEATVTGCVGSGSAQIYLNDDCPGTPLCTMDSFDLQIGDIDIDLQGGASWLYDLIINVFLDIIIDAFQTELSSAMGKAIEAAVNNGTPGRNYVFPTDHEFAILDQRFLTPPKVGDHYITVSHHCNVQDANDFAAQFDEMPVDLPEIADESPAQIFVSSVAFNSMHHVLFNNGLYSDVVDPADGGEYAALLSTDVMASFIPQLADYAGHSIVLSIDSTSRPNASVMPVSFLVNVPTTLTAHLDSAEGEELFTLDWELWTAATFEMWTNVTTVSVGTNVTWFYLDHSPYDQSVSVKTSNIGDFEITQDLEQLMMLLATEAVCPFLTQAGYQSVRMNTADFLNTEDYEVVYHPPGYVMVRTDILQ